MLFRCLYPIAGRLATGRLVARFGAVLAFALLFAFGFALALGLAFALELTCTRPSRFAAHAAALFGLWIFSIISGMSSRAG